MGKFNRLTSKNFTFSLTKILPFIFSSLLHSQKQCVQQVIDADSLLKIITKIVDDIPNICLSKFKMCGGFETPSPYPPPPLDFPEFRSTEDRSPQSNDIPSEEEVVEEVFEDGKFDLSEFKIMIFSLPAYSTGWLERTGRHNSNQIVFH